MTERRALQTAPGLGTRDAPPQVEHEARQEHWGGVFAMSLCVFALIASEFMPVSLLTPLALDLKITEGMAGQGIAISGAFAVVTSLGTATVAARVRRKTLLLALTALMCVSGFVVAIADTYATYMAGRALIGVVVGGFWSMSAATAMRLVAPAHVPRALAIFNGGNALATVIAAPLGSYLASVVGWRGAYFSLVPIAVIAYVWQWFSLPHLDIRQREAGSTTSVWALLKLQRVRLAMLAAGAFFMGQFALFTYLRPFLETVIQADETTLSLMLLVVGVSGLAGTVAIGWFLKRRFYGTLAVIPVVMAAVAVALMAVGPSVAAATALLALWGLVATAAPVGWWSWIAHSLPHDAEAGGGLMVSVVQVSIALGATVGGVLFDASGHSSVFALSAGLLLLGGFLVCLTARADRAAFRGHAT